MHLRIQPLLAGLSGNSAADCNSVTGNYSGSLCGYYPRSGGGCMQRRFGVVLVAPAGGGELLAQSARHSDHCDLAAIRVPVAPSRSRAASGACTIQPSSSAAKSRSQRIWRTTGRSGASRSRMSCRRGQPIPGVELPTTYNGGPSNGSSSR